MKTLMNVPRVLVKMDSAMMLSTATHVTVVTQAS